MESTGQGNMIAENRERIPAGNDVSALTFLSLLNVFFFVFLSMLNPTIIPIMRRKKCIAYADLMGKVSLAALCGWMIICPDHAAISRRVLMMSVCVDPTSRNKRN